MYRNYYDPARLPGKEICEYEIGHKIRADYYPEDYVVLDLETTGLHPESCDIIEICALRYSDNVLVDTFSMLVKPSAPVPLEITRITGITNEMLEHAEDPARALLMLRGFIRDTYVMGYCVKFDVSFLHEKMMKYLKTGFNNWYVDVHDIAKINMPGLARYRQVDVCKELKLSTEGAHRAENDCLMCNGIFQKLKEKYIAGYKEPQPRPALEVTEEGLRRGPFFNKHFYFIGTMEQSTKHYLADAIIGLGATEIDDSFCEHTDFVIVGFGESSALEAEELKLAANRKLLLGAPVIMKEEKFLEGLLKKGYAILKKE